MAICFQPNRSYLPATVGCRDELDHLAALACRRVDAVVSAIAWARLDPDDIIHEGSVAVDPDDPAEAARCLNDHVGTALVDRDVKLGLNMIETFYQHARIAPSWRRLAGPDHSLLNAFGIQIGDGLGFSPYIPAFFRLPPHERVRREMEMFRTLRRASRSFRSALAGAAPGAPGLSIGMPVRPGA